MEPQQYYNTTTTEFFEIQKKTNILKRIFGDQPRINIILLLLTIYSTWSVHGIWYAITIVTILLSHEMGHYLMCKKYNIDATLPYFIPLPGLPPFGTMGAVIRIKERMHNRTMLFDIGLAGPLAGLFFTIPAIIIGLKLSTVVDVQTIPANSMALGDSLIFKFFSYIIIGHLPAGYDVMLHPVAFAGWAGLFVTALNLLPIGQLDGGHIIYALFGRKTDIINKAILSLFIGICVFWFQGWILLILLLLWFGYRHPPPIDDYSPIDKKRRIIGYIVFILFILSFPPVPFNFY